MKAMPALSAPDVVPRTPGQGARKAADGENEGRGADFTWELRKREEPERRTQPPGNSGKDGKDIRPGGPHSGCEDPASLPDPELSARLPGAEGLTGFDPVRRGKRMEGRDETAADAMPCKEIPEGAAVVADLSRLQAQVVPPPKMHNGKGEGKPVTLPVRFIEGMLPEATGLGDAATGDMPDSTLLEGAGGTEAIEGGRRLHHLREMSVEPAGGEERMSMKVVSTSVERHLEPAATVSPGGREGMWRGAAAQVLRALDEGLLPHALAGLDGARSGGPKVIRNLEIQLHPASLGTVTARLTITGGNMEITISVPDRRLADQMERGLDQLVRRIRAHDHGAGQTVVHLVTEAQNQTADRFQQQLPGHPAADGRSTFGGQAREGASGGGHGGGGGGAHADDGGGAGHDGIPKSDGAGRAARRDGLLYL